MISEIIIGRKAGNSPINAMKNVALESKKSTMWQVVGWSGIFAGILILSFYSCLLYTSPSPRDATLSRMPSSA